MTPKEKAKELYKKYDFIFVPNYSSKHEVVECCIVAVNEIIDACNEVYDSDLVHFRETGIGEYWLEVIKELNHIKQN